MVGGVQRLPVNDRILAEDFHSGRYGDMVDGVFLGLIRGAAGTGAVGMDNRIMMVRTVWRMIVRAEKRGLPALSPQIFPRHGIAFAVQVACCWAHVRRYLLEAYDNGYLKVEPLLKLVRDLYKIEHGAKDRAEKKGTDTALFQERKMARRTSAKLVDEFFAQAKALQQTERPSSPAAKAVSYALNIEPELRMFLKDSRLNIDNNPAERLNRGISIIRKNCLFAGSETGGQRLAVLYSFAATCKANNLCFRNWLEDVLPRLSSTPASQIDSLLPPFWKPISK